MREPFRILLGPLVTEKSNFVRESNNQFSFEVDRDANKVEIRQAVEKVFDLKNMVLKVRTVSMTGKYKRRGRRGGYRSDWKKAVITLVKGASIKLFEDA